MDSDTEEDSEVEVEELMTRIHRLGIAHNWFSKPTNPLTPPSRPNTPSNSFSSSKVKPIKTAVTPPRPVLSPLESRRAASRAISKNCDSCFGDDLDGEFNFRVPRTPTRDLPKIGQKRDIESFTGKKFSQTPSGLSSGPNSFHFWEEGIITTSKRNTKPHKAVTTVGKSTQTKAKKKAFQSEVQDLFRELNEKVFESKIPENLEIEWSGRFSKTAGQARLVKKNNVRSARILLSSKIISNSKQLRETLAHELCHVAAFLIDHHTKPPHGKVFKKWANAVMREFPDIEIKTYHNFLSETNEEESDVYEECDENRDQRFEFARRLIY